MSGARAAARAPKRRVAKEREAPTARAVIVGNEILTGKISDKNLGVLARTLRGLGVRLTGAATVPDDLGIIAREVKKAAEGHDWVFTSGGVGPTHDDVTIDAVARAFGKPVVVSRELDRLIRVTYGERLRDGHLLMARVPKGAKLVASTEIPWPVVLMKNVWVLPGVPEIFELKMKLVEATVGRHPTFHSLAVL
ncbi:MAG TPA: molybdopterin-binding protein, partial [Polyangiaceae bacterium]|nr:molybdopterin-binding protein [Polyangiaceae bacterium]